MSMRLALLLTCALVGLIAWGVEQGMPVHVAVAVAAGGAWIVRGETR